MHFVWKLYSATAGWRHPIAPQKKQFHSWTHIHTATHEDTIRSRLKELYRNVAVCVHVGCVYSNISWNWFLAPYLRCCCQSLSSCTSPTHACFALAAAPLQICTEHRHKRAACSHWTRGNKHATCISCSRRLCSVFFINCEVFVFLMIVFVWIWTSLVLAVSQDSYPVPRLSCIGNIIWNVIFSTAPVQI